MLDPITEDELRAVRRGARAARRLTSARRGVPGRELLPLVERLGRARARRAHHAPRQRPPRRHGRAAGRKARRARARRGARRAARRRSRAHRSATATRASPCTTTCRSARRPPRVRASRAGPSFAGTEAAPPDARLELGGRTVEVVPTPGHSPGHVAAWVPDAGLLVAADAVMGNGIPTRDGNAADPLRCTRRRRPIATTIERVRALPLRMLATGHEPILRDDDGRDVPRHQPRGQRPPRRSSSADALDDDAAHAARALRARARGLRRPAGRARSPTSR